MGLRQTEGEKKPLISVSLDDVICSKYEKMQNLQKPAQERQDRAGSLRLLGSKAICGEACPRAYV